MSRNAFIFLLHVCTAGLAGLAVYGLADVVGWPGPRWLPIGIVALLAAGRVNHCASTIHRRMFG
ncbi:hypothetical protein FG93_04418 [Bosea sp. LC85]|uniref:hypothetical protein n=1 Tax=Bosea sp. LC85 TaxID=1502851 RepID=UPI0004E2D13D|nr:hypothetical protein [Bosea sp. LC85]KFC66488.1 hypothetical protein FG93_04418 [Bosea sp. LC85]